MDLGALYSDTQREVVAEPTWKLRWLARQAWREYDQNPSDPAQVRAVAIDHVLTKRGVKGRAPQPGERFNRLA